jgi:peptidoglycan hydrolase-like protein with peptidoglycan-binding domain
MKKHTRIYSAIIAAGVLIAIIVPASGYAASSAEQEIIAQLQAQIRVLQARLDALVAAPRPPASDQGLTNALQSGSQAFENKLNEALGELAGIPASGADGSQGATPPSGGVRPGFKFPHDLFFGMRANSDVANLQKFLADQGYYSGEFTGNFLSQTREAVKKFQSASGIASTGYFGPLSRGSANDLAAQGSGGVGVTSSGTLSIEPPQVRLEAGASAPIKVVFAPSRPVCLDAIPSCKISERAPYEVNAVFVSGDPRVAVVEEIADKSCDPPRACPIASTRHYAARGVSAGATTIVASYTSGGVNLTAKTDVEVTAPAADRGYIMVEPSPVALRTGESVVLRASYQPPMPPCPTRLSCVQVMPARMEITPEYISDNPAVAAIERTVTKKSCADGAVCANAVISSVKGLSAGKTFVTASFVREAGTAPMTTRMDVAVTPGTAAGGQILPPSFSSSSY